MDLKYGKALLGALAAVTVSTFTIPFCSSASASTGTMITRHDAGPAIQLAQAEQEESVEKKTEEKTKVQTDTEAAPGAVTVAPAPVVVAPAAPAPVVSGEVEKKHEESKTTESERSENGMSGSSERRENEMSSDSKAVPGAMEQESEREEHQSSKKVEQNQ